VAFLAPFAYFVARGRIPVGSRLFKQCSAMVVGIGAQGALGWYMVKSGLEHERFEDPDNPVPRVSHFRLMAHLMSALALYSGMFWVGTGLLFPAAVAATTTARAVRGAAIGVSHLTATTIMAGALVAGRDAGLAYNTFPLMDEQWVPEGIMRLEPIWKNFILNDTMIQFQHRYLGLATLGATFGASAVGFKWVNAAMQSATNTPEQIARLASVRRAIAIMLLTANAQVGLGIATLVSFVPVHLAAAHQAGSVALLTSAMWVVRALKRVPK
jgi:heme a synthase